MKTSVGALAAVTITAGVILSRLSLAAERTSGDTTLYSLDLIPKKTPLPQFC